jgi:hypothetical protein
VDDAYLAVLQQSEVLCDDLATVILNGRGNYFGVRFFHRRDFDLIKSQEQHVASGIPGGEFCCLCLYVECRQLSFERFSARLDCGQSVGLT